jgi:tetratricopeptide (TPR) repeat protein
MRLIEPPDIHHLRAALGWLGLGNCTEAEVELEKVSPANRRHPEFLEVRWEWCAKSGEWDTGVEVAEEMVSVSPDEAGGWLNRAYALRRAKGGGLQMAYAALRPAAEKFPKQALICYNLACYCCQMDNLPEAREWFARALKLGGAKVIRKMALADDDLKPLWEEIKTGDAAGEN